MFSAIDAGDQLWAGRRRLAGAGDRPLLPLALDAAPGGADARAGARRVPGAAGGAARRAAAVSGRVSRPALAGLQAGNWLAVQYAWLVGALFEPAALPFYLPRFVTIMLLLLLVVLGGGAVAAWLRARGCGRRTRGGLWWELLGNPARPRAGGAVAHREVVARSLRGPLPRRRRTRRSWASATRSCWGTTWASRGSASWSCSCTTSTGAVTSCRRCWPSRTAGRSSSGASATTGADGIWRPWISRAPAATNLSTCSWRRSACPA